VEAADARQVPPLIMPEEDKEHILRCPVASAIAQWRGFDGT